jgi:hypothetical protein
MFVFSFLKVFFFFWNFLFYYFMGFFSFFAKHLENPTRNTMPEESPTQATSTGKTWLIYLG